MKLALFTVLLICLQPSMFAAEDVVPTELAEGFSAFEHGAYESALGFFQAARMREDASRWRGHATFWEARTVTMLGRFEHAAAGYDRLLSDYPTHPYMEEAHYHRARVSVLQGNHESALERFAGFLERYPRSEFRPDAVYWIAESLVSIGHLDEAELLFIEVAERYPTSLRAEASRHRLNAIDSMRREADLLALLRFNRAQYDASLSDLERAVEERDRRIDELHAELERLQRGLGSRGTLQDTAETGPRDELLLMRARAIELQEAVLRQRRGHE
jgi:tetratricopeptide (TPR) repeat protein